MSELRPPVGDQHEENIHSSVILYSCIIEKVYIVIFHQQIEFWFNFFRLFLNDFALFVIDRKTKPSCSLRKELIHAWFFLLKHLS